MQLCNKFFCSIISKGAPPFDFIKGIVIQKLTYKVKYINQINGGLMFFGGSRIRFFKICWLNCGQYDYNQYKKKEHNKHSSVFKVLR